MYIDEKTKNTIIERIVNKIKQEYRERENRKNDDREIPLGINLGTTDLE